MARRPRPPASASGALVSRVVEGYGLTELGPGVLIEGKAVDLCEVKIVRAMRPGGGLAMGRSSTLAPQFHNQCDAEGFFAPGIAVEKEGRIRLSVEKPILKRRLWQGQI